MCILGFKPEIFIRLIFTIEAACDVFRNFWQDWQCHSNISPVLVKPATLFEDTA